MIHWTYIVFGIGMIFLLYQSLRDHGDRGGDYNLVGGLINIFWNLITIIWFVIWGGILWW